MERAATATSAIRCVLRAPTDRTCVPTRRNAQLCSGVTFGDLIDRKEEGS
jgi:hypothetical protein